MALTVRQFIFQMYRLINASNPTVPLHGDDESLALMVMNQIISSYASSGLMLTIAKTVSIPINIGVFEIKFVPYNYNPITTHTEIVTLTTGFPNFTVLNSSFYSVGDAVMGTGIPVLTFIQSIAGNNIVLTKNATITGPSSLTFTHNATDSDALYIQSGRLANLDNAWLDLDGVTYPLIDKSRDDFLASWKFNPLQGLPRFIITFPDTNIVTARLYPAPSQFFTFFCRGKFQFSPLSVNDDLSEFPDYYILFFLYAVAKYVSKFKSRGSAWTPDLEADYRELKDNMEAASEVNLSIIGDEQSLLNANWRVMAGI